MSNLGQRAVEPAGKPAAVGGPIGSPRNFVLACIGMLSLLADEVPALLEQSVLRGSAGVERAQAEANRRRAPLETPPPIADEVPQDLSRRGLLTHRDLEHLLQQMIELEQHIDQLATRHSAAQ
jgi:hypothetical protein